MITYSSKTVTRMLASLTIVVAVIIGFSVVQAQEGVPAETNDQLRACDAIADTMEKLACFDAVVKGINQPPAAAPAIESASVAEAPAKAPAAEAPAPEMTAAPASESAPAAAAAVVIVKEQPVASGTVAVETATPAAASSDQAMVSTASPEEEFGLSREQAEEKKQPKEGKKEEKLESIRATIVESWATLDGRFEARLDNGQVWRETERTRWSGSNLPKAGKSVVISKGRFGGYRMKIGTNNRLAAVRRTD
jgi:hypothetical protein